VIRDKIIFYKKIAVVKKYVIWILDLKLLWRLQRMLLYTRYKICSHTTTTTS